MTLFKRFEFRYSISAIHIEQLRMNLNYKRQTVLSCSNLGLLPRKMQASIANFHEFARVNASL